MARRALLVIDMQKGDRKTFEGLYKREQMLSNISKLIDAFHKSKDKVIQVKIWITDPKKTTMLRKCTNCGIADTPEAEVFEELKDKHYDLIVKKTNYSAFWKTDLEKYLRKNRIKELYLVGIHTGACILFTAVDAFYRGYETFVVSDAVSSVADEKGIKEKLHKIKDLCGDLVLTDALIEKINNK